MLLIYAFTIPHFHPYFRLYSYLLKKQLSVRQPHIGFSGRIPESGIVITGDDSPMGVVAPEGGQDVRVDDSDIDDPYPA